MHVQPGIVINDYIYNPTMPVRAGVGGYDGTEGLGDFWSNLVKKVPRIVTGAGTSLLMGGTGNSTGSALLTAAAGGVAAAIPKRKAGTSLLADIGIGAGMGAITGTAIGTYRGLTAPLNTDITKIGLAGKATQYIETKFFPRTLSATEHGPPVSSTSSRLINVVKSNVTSEDVKTAAKAGAAMLLPVLAAGMTGGGGVTEPVSSTQSSLQGRYTPQQTYATQAYTSNGQAYPASYYGQAYVDQPATQYVSGGGGGDLIPITDPSTGQVVYVPRPSFWDQYKTYILIGAGVVVSGALLYKTFKSK